MTEVDAPDVFGFAIFCDDIRMEVDGKTTIVGSYNGTMAVRGTLPAALPKFAINAIFFQRKTVYIPNLTLKIFMPDDPLPLDKATYEIELQAPPQEALVQSELPMVIARANIILAPMIINSLGLIKVRVLRDGLLHRLGSLAVTMEDVISSNEPPPPS